MTEKINNLRKLTIAVFSSKDWQKAEEPLTSHDKEALTELSTGIGVSITGDETLQDLTDLEKDAMKKTIVKELGKMQSARTEILTKNSDIWA